jgi:hypothetical protein
MQSHTVREPLDSNTSAMPSTNVELDVLAALVLEGTSTWQRLALRARLDDDALSDAIEVLVARGAITIVRSAQPSLVAFRITDAGLRELAPHLLETPLDGLEQGLARLAAQRRNGANEGVGNPARVTRESAPAALLGARRYSAARAGGMP